MNRLYFLFFLVSSFSGRPVFAAISVSLEDYLSQVSASNREFRSARESAEGADLRSSESALIYSPVFSAEYQRVVDHKTNALFPAAYSKFLASTYSLGISQRTSFGLGGKLSYSLISSNYVNSLPPRPQFYEGRPMIELSQSFLRNGFGSEAQAQAELVEASARSTQYSQSYRAKAIRAEAEAAYVRLAAARELRRINDESLKSAHEILDWTSRRVRMNLGEDSDRLQAQANIESSELQLHAAVDAERIASRNFNRLREIDGDTVLEILELPAVATVKVPPREALRDDVRAAIEGARATASQSRLGRERNRAELEVYASYAMNSRDNERSEAMSESLSASDAPTAVIGVRFSTPLLFGAQAQAMDGYGKEAVAADLLKDRKLFEQETQWKDLVLQLDEAKQRYEIAVRLADVQKRKAETERGRLRRGRSTTYQTLLFDQDYIQAVAAKVQSQSEVLQIMAQMKTFGNAL